MATTVRPTRPSRSITRRPAATTPTVVRLSASATRRSPTSPCPSTRRWTAERHRRWTAEQAPRSLPGPMVMDPLRATTSSPVPIPALSSSTHNLRKELTLKEGGAAPHPLCMREGDYFGRPISVRSVRLRPALLVLPTVLCQGSPDDSRPGRHSADRNEEDRWHDHLPPVRLTPAPRQRSE